MGLLHWRNIKLWFLIVFNILKRNRNYFLFGLIVLALAVIGQLKFKIFQNPNTISIGFIGTYQEHDLPEDVTKFLSQGLVSEGVDGRIHGNLVSGWDTNNDATSFKFKLKDNLHWGDGSQISSQDMEFDIPNIQVSDPDNKTIKFDLKDSYSPLPSLLTKPIFKKGTLIGTGPYKITKIEKSRIFITKLELEPEDEALPKINIRFYPNEKVAMEGFNLGEVQALAGITNSKAFVNSPGIALMQKVDYTKIVSILFDTKNDILSNRSFRQALAYDAPKIDNEQVADNPYPPFLWAYNPDSKKYLSDTEDAKAALDRAKANLPDDKLKSELTLTTTSNLEDIANKIADSWKQLGINVKVRVEEGIAQNFQSLLITQSIPLDPDQYFLWHATQTKTNLTKYDSKRADKDLEDGRKLLSEDDRKQKYFDFQRTLLEDAPAVFLYFPKYNIVYLKKKQAVLDKILSL